MLSFCPDRGTRGLFHFSSGRTHPVACLLLAAILAVVESCPPAHPGARLPRYHPPRARQHAHPARPRTHTHSLDPLAETGLTISKLAPRPPSTVCLAVRIRSSYHTSHQAFGRKLGLFRERMREICQSDSMSGNSKKDQAKPD